jgi:hypothetical protein
VAGLSFLVGSLRRFESVPILPTWREAENGLTPLKKQLAWVLGVSLVVMFALAGISQTYALGPLIVVIFAFAGVVISSAVGMIFRRYAVARGFAWLLVLGVISFPITQIVVACQSGATERVAITVTAALEAYRGAHGNYPVVLVQLVPEHFSSVPKTRFGLAGTAFFYHRDTNGFRLGYILPARLVRSYDSTTREWTIRD